NRYYLELRTKRGLDNKNTIPGPRVFVHVVGDIPQTNQTATFDWVLDMDPTTSAFDGMNVGQTFNDPAGGVSFTVQAADNDRATINVNVTAGSGSPTCMDGMPFTAPGPTSCGTPTGGTGGMGGMGGAGAGGSAGRGGSGGRGGAAGSGTGGMPGAGTGGIGGTSTAGTPGGGAAGAAGQSLGGAAGAAGAVGPGGAGGVPGGSGGVPVTGGAGVGVSGTPGAGTPGTGGGPVAGAAGTLSIAGGSGTGPVTGPEASDPLAEDVGGCGCRTVPRRRGSGALWALALLGLGFVRRRRAS